MNGVALTQEDGKLHILVEASIPTLVSVLLPLGDKAEEYRCLETISTLFDQSLGGIEVVLLGARKLDEKLRVKLECFANRGRLVYFELPTDLGVLNYYYGIERSVGEKILFSEPGCVYSQEALKALYDCQLKDLGVKVTYGIINVFNSETKKTESWGTTRENYETLLTGNRIHFLSVLLDKCVIRRIGFLDPMLKHSRDSIWWNFFFYASQHYVLKSVDSIVATCTQITKDNSKDYNFPLSRPSLIEYFNARSSDVFSGINSHNISQLKVFSSFSDYLRKNLGEHLTEQKEHYESIEHSVDQGYILIYETINASVEFPFRNLPSHLSSKLINRPNLADDILNCLDLVLNARGIIFCRNISGPMLLLSTFLKDQGIPYFYYTDDNLFELGQVFMNRANRRFLESANAFILSSESLKPFFYQYFPLKEFLMVGPIVSDTQASLAPNDSNHFRSIQELRLVFASNDRHQAFLDLSDGIKDLARDYDVKIYIYLKPGITPDCPYAHEYRVAYKHKKITLEFITVEICHNVMVNYLAQQKVHFFIHPMNQNYSVNYKNKTLNFLLNGYLTSSVVLFSDVKPYSTLKDYGSGVLAHTIDNGRFVDSIRKLASDIKLVEAVLEEAKSCCLEYFNWHNNAVSVKQMISVSPVVTTSCLAHRKKRFRKLYFGAYRIFFKSVRKRSKLRHNIARIFYRLQKESPLGLFKHVLRKISKSYVEKINT